MIAQCNLKIKLSEEEIKNLKNKLTEYEQKHKDQEENITKLHLQEEQYISKLDKLKKDINDLKQENEKKENNFKAQLDKLNKKINELKQENQNKDNKLLESSENDKKFKFQLDELNKEISLLKQQNQNKDKKLAEINEKENYNKIKLNSEIEKYNSKINQKELELSSIKNEKEKLQLQLEEYKKKLDNNYIEHNNEISKIREEFNILKKEKNEEQLKKEENIIRNKELIQKIIKLEKKLEEYEIENIQMKDNFIKLKEYEEKLQKYEKENAQLKVDLEEIFLKNKEILMKLKKKVKEQNEVNNINNDKNKLLAKEKKNKIYVSINETIHEGIKCENCNKCPIYGERYKCSKCDNYNLCKDCEDENSNTNRHPHNFIKIRNVEIVEKKNNIDIKKTINTNINEIKYTLPNNIKDFNSKNFSYSIENLIDTYLIYCGTKKFLIRLSIRNNSNIQYPGGLFLICLDKSTLKPYIKETKIKKLKPNETQNFSFLYYNIEALKPSIYFTYLGIYYNNEIIGKLIQINLNFIEKTNFELADIFINKFNMITFDSKELVVNSLIKRNCNFIEALNHLLSRIDPNENIKK